jgi:CIC family chloride channel protein
MTAVVIIFEMTTDFNVVLPLMICSVVSYLVAEKLDPGSIYDQLLEWGGIDAESLQSQPSIMKTMTAGQIMKHPVETIDELATVTEIQAQFAASRHHGFPVLDQDKNIVGMLTEHDLLTSNQEQEEEITAQKIMVPNPVTIDVEQSLAEAVLLFDNYKISRIPVVDNGRLVGIVTREDVASAENSTLPDRADHKVASFVTYETRALSESKSRVLVVLQEDSEVNRRSLVSMAAIIAKNKSFDLECLHVQANTKSDCDHRLLVQQAEAVARELVVTVHTSVRLAKHQATAVGEIIDRRPVEMVVLALNSATDLIELELIVEQTTCPILASSSSSFSSSCLGNARAIVLSTVGLDQKQTAIAHATGQLFQQSLGPKDATLKVIAIEHEKTSKIIEQFSQNDHADELVILALSRQNFIALIKDAGVRELLKCQEPILFSVIQ